MYKVVIIDDEPIIVKGLSCVIKWEEYGCELVGSASNGKEGLELIRCKRPDIIFSDIAMPGMDGLQMIASLKLECPDAMITILTGYRDFDFAQKAVNLGVNRFLLKPSNLSEIEEAVRFMVEKLENRKKVTKSVGEKPAAEKETVENSAGNAGSFIVKKALEYMEQNYKEKITLTELADELYVSQWHLSKLLNKHTKKSFSELLNEIRVREAKELLKDPTLRVGDVAEIVGFLDIAHFSRVFKKYTNMSANEYRSKKLG